MNQNNPQPITAEVIITPPPSNGGGDSNPPSTDNGGGDSNPPSNTNDPISNGDKGTNAEPIAAEGDEIPIDGVQVVTPTLVDINTSATSYGLEDTITLTLDFNNPDKITITEIIVNDVAYTATKITDEEYTITIPVSDITDVEGEFLLTISGMALEGLSEPIAINSNNELTITISSFNTIGFIVASTAIAGTAGTAYFVTSTTKGKDLFKKIFKK